MFDQCVFETQKCKHLYMNKFLLHDPIEFSIFFFFDIDSDIVIIIYLLLTFSLFLLIYSEYF